VTLRWARGAVLLAVACGYHDTPVATYHEPLPEPAGGAAGETSGMAGAPLAASAGESTGGADGGASDGGAPSGPACQQTYPLTVEGLSSRYKHGAGGAVWVDAERECELEGAHLIVIDDQLENDWMKSVAAAAVTDDASTNQLAWIGLTDQAKEGEFAWVNGAVLGLMPWSGGEPNSLYGAEDCVEMRSNGEWNDDRCNAMLTYVCECDAVPSVGNWCDTSRPETCGDCSTTCTAEQSCASQVCQ
jgi:hypothetical protein